MIFKAAIGTACLTLCGAALAAEWHVEVTNVTPGQSFTPIIATLIADLAGDLKPVSRAGKQADGSSLGSRLPWFTPLS
jgi:hypothetical protein